VEMPRLWRMSRSVVLTLWSVVRRSDIPMISSICCDLETLQIIGLLRSK
jgi:hypothetical protein